MQRHALPLLTPSSGIDVDFRKLHEYVSPGWNLTSLRGNPGRGEQVRLQLQGNHVRITFQASHRCTSICWFTRNEGPFARLVSTQLRATRHRPEMPPPCLPARQLVSLGQSSRNEPKMMPSSTFMKCFSGWGRGPQSEGLVWSCSKLGSKITVLVGHKVPLPVRPSAG